MVEPQQEVYMNQHSLVISRDLKDRCRRRVSSQGSVFELNTMSKSFRSCGIMSFCTDYNQLTSLTCDTTRL